MIWITMMMVMAADPSDNSRKLLERFRAEFIQITPGRPPYGQSFTMGRDAGGGPSERPAHQVRMGADFYIAKFEVPQNLWQSIMGTNPSRWQGPRNSVEMLSFDQAVTFCQRVTAQMREHGLIKPNEVIRLPSEAEWEYVARGGTTTVYSFGDDPSRLGQYAWYTQNAAGNDPPVGAKAANPFGLYDVHGYLWEWCADTGQANYDGAPTDGTARSDGDSDLRVLRGGSWKDDADKLTSTYRRLAPRTLRDDAVGLRCVLSRGK